MPYTKDNAPDWVKALPAEAKDAWVKAYNAAFKQYNGDEGKANATASATIKKMGYKKDDDGKWVKSQEAAVESALVALSVFGAEASPRVTALADGVAEVEVGKQRHRVEYTAKGGGYAFGKPQLVAESLDPFDARESDDFALEVVEADADWDNGNWPVVIIRAGDNEKKQRRYTNRALESVDPAKYEGLPMHIDHAGREGQATGPRSLRDFAGKVIKAWHAKTAEGVAEIRGIAHVFDSWLRERGRDEHFRQSLGLSHVANIAGRRERIGNRVWQVVEAISNPEAVDFVTRAAFGGRVTESELDKRAEELMALDTLTVQDLRDKRPDLVEALEGEVTVRLRAQEDESEAVKAARAEADAAKQRAAMLLKTTVQSAAVAEAAKSEHGVPESARDQFVSRVTARVGDNVEPDKVTATVAEAAKAEAEYLKAVAPKPDVRAKAAKPLPAGDEPSRVQKAADALLG